MLSARNGNRCHVARLLTHHVSESLLEQVMSLQTRPLEISLQSLIWPDSVVVSLRETTETCATSGGSGLAAFSDLLLFIGFLGFGGLGAFGFGRGEFGFLFLG
jgi:hypothetical protein